MEDPIPAGFITLPEALQRIADRVSEAHVESAKPDFQANVHAIAKTRRGEGQSATATPESPKSEGADALRSRWWKLQVGRRVRLPSPNRVREVCRLEAEYDVIDALTVAKF